MSGYGQSASGVCRCAAAGRFARKHLVGEADDDRDQGEVCPGNGKRGFRARALFTATAMAQGSERQLNSYLGLRGDPSVPGLERRQAFVRPGPNTDRFMAVRADLGVKRGDMNGLKGLRISSSTAFPNMALRHMLAEAGIDLERDKVQIVPNPPTTGKNELWRGHDGVDAIEQGPADAYWGNGMRAAIGERVWVSQKSILTCGAAMARRERACIISRR